MGLDLEDVFGCLELRELWKLGVGGVVHCVGVGDVGQPL